MTSMPMTPLYITVVRTLLAFSYLQDEMGTVGEGLCADKLSLNVSKTKFMILWQRIMATKLNKS